MSARRALCFLVMLAAVGVAGPAWSHEEESVEASRCTRSVYRHCPAGGCAAISQAPPADLQLPACGQGVDKGAAAVRFAVIGDYGFPDDRQNCECHVANLIRTLERRWGLDFIITVGDNNYYKGAWDTMYENVTRVYGSYIPSSHDRPDTVPRFFPTLGNHDWDTPGPNFGLPYLSYFHYLRQYPPGNGEWYRYAVPGGLVELFGLNSNLGEPGEPWTDPARHREMMGWLRDSLDDSKAAWKIVYFHHSPYSTARADPQAPWMRFNYGDWGASVVLTGHEHVYERIVRDDLTYIINGLGGITELYEIDGPACTPVEGSRKRYNKAHGTLYVVASERSLDLCMYSIENGVTLVDSTSIAPGGEDGEASPSEP